MTKSTYLLPAALLMLASCSQDEPTAVSDRSHGEKIIFRTSLPEVISRAKVVYNTDIEKFHVTAFNTATVTDGPFDTFIDNVELEKNENSGFYSSLLCQWPEKGHESDILQFFAYYPEFPSSASLANGSTVSEGTANLDYKITDYSIAPDIADQVDFVTASATGSMADNLFSGITLNFGHQLSRIRVNAWGANKSCDIEIAGVRIGGVNVEGTFDFKPAEGASVWSAQKKGEVEYIYRVGDQLLTLSRGQGSHATAATAASVMGSRLNDSDDNTAMLIPTTDANGWDYAKDRNNDNKGMYISVLLRIIDRTATTGNGKQQYPYLDTNQGPNAMKIPVVYLAVDKATGKDVTRRLYKKNREDTVCYTDEDCTAAYTLTDTEDVKEFGWAALPVTANWEPGYIYTYTLDYSYGIGLHGPEITGDAAPKAGDPVISDRVGVNVSVNDWQGLNGSTTHPVEVPGS